MALVKRYDMKGLNLRQNDLVRNPENARDLKNVVKNGYGDIAKREGWTQEVADGSQLDMIPYGTDGMVRVSGTEASGSESSQLALWNGSGWDQINKGYYDSVTDVQISGYSELVSHAEYDGNLYIADPALNNNVMKYDGKMFYRASLPKPELVSESNQGGAAVVALNYRIIFNHIDNNGSITYSDYVEKTGTILNQESVRITINTLYDTEFDSKTLVTTGATQTVTEAGATLQTINVTSHNFVAGDYLYYREAVFDSVNKLQVSSVTASTVEFDTSEMNGDATFETDTAYSNTKLMIFRTSDTTNNTNYTLLTAPIVPDLNSLGTTMDINIQGTWGYEITDPAMLDIVDDTVVRQPPQKCKYITVFRNQLVTSNMNTDEYAGNDAQTIYGKNFVQWSDTGLGSSVESFLPFDNVGIGKSDEGEVTGIFSNNDYLLVFKQRGLYWINGDLIGGRFTVQPVFTNGVGCVAHRSIKEISGACAFLSERGLYLTKGGAYPVEISDIIEPLFTDDTNNNVLSSAIGEVDIQRERYLLYIPGTINRILMYNYYWEQWFLWEGIDAAQGMVIINDLLYHHDTSGTNKEISAKNDNGAAISAYYTSSWENLGEPSLKKRFLDLKLFSLGNTNVFSVDIEAQHDWNSTIVTDQTKNITASNRFIKQKTNQNQSYSTSFTIKNEVLDEDLYINGYEYEYEPTQRMMKR